MPEPRMRKRKPSTGESSPAGEGKPDAAGGEDRDTPRTPEETAYEEETTEELPDRG